MHGLGHNAQNFTKEEFDRIKIEKNTNQFGGILEDGNEIADYVDSNHYLEDYLNLSLAKNLSLSKYEDSPSSSLLFSPLL
jgi:hypothetical protein